jgi:hypothetical protein
VHFVAPAGDYNATGGVDAADYALWRKTLGSTTDLRADGSANGVVDDADYELWRATFGQTSAPAVVTNAMAQTSIQAAPAVAAVLNITWSDVGGSSSNSANSTAVTSNNKTEAVIPARDDELLIAIDYQSRQYAGDKDAHAGNSTTSTRDRNNRRTAIAKLAFERIAFTGLELDDDLLGASRHAVDCLRNQL